MKLRAVQIQPLTTSIQVRQMTTELVIMIWMTMEYWMLMRLMDVQILQLTIMIP